MERGYERSQDKGLREKRQEEEEGQRFLCVNNVEDEGKSK